MAICRNIYQKRVRNNAFKSFTAKYKIVKSGCWEWIGSLNENGYGQLNIGNKKIMLAHRFSYQTYIGDLNGFFVCHKCDNTRCVSPFHLFIGTNTDNMRDAAIKGRLASVDHPSDNHYSNFGCRCDGCKKAHSDVSKKYRDRNKEIIKERKRLYYLKTKNRGNNPTVTVNQP
jgi:hypothetical protein